MKQATQQAIDLHRQGKTIYAAAKLAGVAQSTVARALAREAQRCPTCGALPRSDATTRTTGFSVKHDPNYLPRSNTYGGAK